VEGLVTSSAAVGESASSRTLARVLYGPLLTLAVGLCAAAPVIAASARALHEGWQPVADRGIIATRAFDVFSSHMPLVGQYSFAGAVTGKLTYSFGPMLYWLLAPAAHVGAPSSFVLTMAFVNVACVLGAVALARRRGGVWLMVAAAVGIGLMCRSLAANNFYDIWNPSVGLFPLLALIFVGWSLACGDYRLLPVAALLASYLLQLEDSFVPTALGVSAVALVGVVVWWLRARRSGAGAPRMWPWALAAAVVLVICWTPPLIDQIAHEGNFGHVVQAATERKSSLGGTVGVHAVVRTVGVRPWWLVRPSDPFVRKHDVLHPASSGANVSAALILGWLVVAIALALRRRRQDLVAGAATALVLCLAVYATASATPTKRMLAETLGYTLWSATTVGMFVWLMALWTGVVLSGADKLLARGVTALAERARWRPEAWRAAARTLAALAALGLAALAGGVGAAAGQPDEHAFEFAALGAINSRLGAVPRGHSVYLNARLDGLITPLRPEMTYDLRRRGVRALGVGAYLRTGHWYERAEHPYDYVVWVYDNGRPPVAGARVIAVAHIRSGGRRHTIEVAVSRAPPRAAAARARTARSGASPALARSDPNLSRWSAPRELGRCAVAGPEVAFPSEAPSIPTGRGAIVWASQAAGCAAPTAPAAAGWTLWLAALSAGERAVPVSTRTLSGQPPAELQLVGGSRGRITAAAALRASGASASGRYVLLQGRAKAGARPSGLLGGSAQTLALARAYLGDVALATLTPAAAIAVRVQRYFRARFVAQQPIAIAAAPVGALTATMDYRSDVLVAWQQNGFIYARMVRASSRSDPTQRLGAGAPNPQLRALVSDNDHGMVAWSTTQAAPGGTARTSVFVDLSAAGVRFGAPQRLASFSDPSLAGHSAGSLQLVRLSSENVLLAWTVREHGHYVVRAAPAVYAATRPSALLSDPHAQSVLGGLAAGPAGEAIAVWRASHGAAFDAGRAELWASRAFIARHDRPGSAPAERLAAAGPNTAGSVAVDPANDHAVVAWLAGGPQARVEYASAAGAAGYRPRPATAALPRSSGGTHWLRITLAALAVAALAGLGAVALRRRKQSVS
jgi:hypothetical protein